MTVSNLNPQYGDNVTVTIEDDLKLYAQWEIITYTITYELNSGELPEGQTNPASYTVETDDFTLVNPIRTGYSFGGWYDGSTSAQTVTIPKGSTGNRSFEAGIWVVNSYTVRYEPNSGSGSVYTGQFFYDLEQSLMHQEQIPALGYLLLLQMAGPPLLSPSKL